MKADGFCTTNKQAQRQCLLISMCKADLFKYEYVAYRLILVTAAPWHLSLFALLLKIVVLSLDLFRCHICRQFSLLPPYLYLLQFPPPSRVYHAQEDAKHTRFMWCHKHLKSLPCPHQKAVPFSLSSPLPCSLSLSCSQARGTRHSFKMPPMPSLKSEVV